MPSVSVIVPNYNHAPFLRTRIESILVQTFDDYEIILMDDFSTDKSNEIIGQYAKHPKVTRVLVNTVNSGSPFAQWNKGVAAANGKFVWIAESDDYADPHFLEQAMQKFQSSPDIGLVFCESYLVDETDSPIGTTRDWRMKHENWPVLEQNSVFIGIDFCRDLLTARCAIPNASAVVFKRSLFDTSGGADTSCKLTGDWKLWFNLLLDTKGAFIATPLNYFRCHAQTVRAVRENIMKEETLLLLKQFYRQLAKRKQSNYQMLEHIFNWSFKKSLWTGKPRYSLANMRLYFKNASWGMVTFFLFSKLRLIIDAHIRYQYQKRL